MFACRWHGREDPLYLCFSSEGGHVADLLRPQRVDDRALSHIRVADETHTDLLFVRVELWEAEKRSQDVAFPQQPQLVLESWRLFKTVLFCNKPSGLLIAPETRSKRYP